MSIQAKLFAYNKVKVSGEDNRGLVAEATFGNALGTQVWVEEESASGHRGRWVQVAGYEDWAQQNLNDHEFGYLQIKEDGQQTIYLTIHNPIR